MKTHSVIITETFTLIKSIEADTEDEAVALIKRRYFDGDIIVYDDGNTKEQVTFSLKQSENE